MVASACVNAVVNGSGRQRLRTTVALRAVTAAGGGRSDLLHYLFYLLSRKLAESANTSRNLPGSLQEVFSQLLPDSS
jgi:hypothetical protein